MKKFILFDHDGEVWYYKAFTRGQDFSRASHRIDTLSELKDIVLEVT